MSDEFRLGLVVNPLAGLGGPLALKGSDDVMALRPDVLPAAHLLARAESRALRCLERIANNVAGVIIYGFDGAMGGRVAELSGLPFVSLGRVDAGRPSCPDDTANAAMAAVAAGVDLLLFVGGDGTARDMCRAVGPTFPVLGVPAGVKMHSGVYAVSPESAADIVIALCNGALVEIGEQEVRDIDEAAFRGGRVSTRHYGELLVPQLGGFLQRVKDSGREVETLAVAEIADELLETLEDDCLYIVGPGSTTAAFMSAMQLPYTLLGFDLVLNGELLAADADAQVIASMLDRHRGDLRLVITAIGGQGHLLGRGNQQLTPAILRRIGRARLCVIATKTKLSRLEGRPLLIDSDDPEIDTEWSGYITVITGYRDHVMYRVGHD